MSNKVCFFTSIGEDLTLIKYIRQNYNYDIVCNYYNTKLETFNNIKKLTNHSEKHKDCKFPSLKKIYNSYIKDQNYEYIFVYDDDALIVKDSLETLLKVAKDYNLDMVSSAHDINGKITWKIHLPVMGNHIFRYVNFIEINFPIFSKNGLSKFINEYDEKLCDYGIDHWYTKILNPEINMNMGIVDTVVIHNPKNSTKLNSVVSHDIRMKQMNSFLSEYKIPKIKPKTLAFEYL